MHSARTVSAALFSMFVVLVFCYAAFSSTPAKQEAAQDQWEFYAADEDGNRYAYNAANVERLKNNRVKVWVQSVYAEKNPKYKAGRFQWEIDCSKKRIRGLQAYATKKDGSSITLTESSDWSDIPADSTAQKLQEMTCGKKGK